MREGGECIYHSVVATIGIDVDGLGALNLGLYFVSILFFVLKDGVELRTWR